MPRWRWSGRGASAQAAVAGAYAWAVTVAPICWTHGASWVARGAALTALLTLGGGIAGEPRWGQLARFGSLWGFVLSSGVAWSAAPFALGPSHIDAQRGFAGMLAWSLFALASSAPALHSDARSGDDTHRSDAAVTSTASAEPLAARRRLAGGDAVYLIGGAVLAASLQVAGWGRGGAAAGGSGPERALLVRLVGVAAGLGILGAATELALARHATRVPRSWRNRIWGRDPLPVLPRARPHRGGWPAAIRAQYIGGAGEAGRGRVRATGGRRPGGAAAALAALVLLTLAGLLFVVRAAPRQVVP